MKTLTKVSVIFLFIISTACDGGGSGSDDDAINNSNLGSFEGSFQVSDDPQTDLGYIFNSRASFKKVGDKFTMIVNGDDGFNRTYEGVIEAEGANSSFIMGLEKQTGPVDKIAAGTIALGDNTASITIELANDAVMLKNKVNDTTTFEIAGKLRISGSFIKSE